MKEQIKNNFKSKKGITLIALVVTIVVLLILAGVSISMLGGENGIITQAIEAKDETTIGEEKEKVQLAATAAKTKNNWGEITQENLEDELDNNIGNGKYTLSKNGDTFTVTYKDSNRSYIVEANGEIADSEEIEKKALKFLVNSGDDGIVGMPIIANQYGEYEINWGDGTTGIEGKLTSKIGIEVASIDKIYIADNAGNAITHIYSEKNKEYVVTITGNFNVINTNVFNYTPEKIIEVLQWGETGLTYINLSDSINLRKIASPTENSFINIEDFSYTFYGCTSLTSIPENLFANCPNVQSFEGTFQGCTNLTSIPKDLFANCPNVESFMRTFYECTSLTSIPENLFANCPNVESFRETFRGCTNLTGNPIPLWERVENGSSNGYIGIPKGNACYYRCENLNDYNNIPDYWRLEFLE